MPCRPTAMPYPPCLRGVLRFHSFWSRGSTSDLMAASSQEPFSTDVLSSRSLSVVGTEPRLPPLDGHDTEGQLKRATVKFLGELGHHDDSVGEPFAAQLGLNLNGRAATGSHLPSNIGGWVGGVKQVGDPYDVTGQLDVPVQNLGVRFGVEHYRGPPAQDLVAVF